MPHHRPCMDAVVGNVFVKVYKSTSFSSQLNLIANNLFNLPAWIPPICHHRHSQLQFLEGKSQLVHAIQIRHMYVLLMKLRMTWPGLDKFAFICPFRFSFVLDGIYLFCFSDSHILLSLSPSLLYKNCFLHTVIKVQAQIRQSKEQELHCNITEIYMKYCDFNCKMHN